MITKKHAALWITLVILTASFVTAFSYKGVECSTEPLDYLTFNNTGFSYFRPNLNFPLGVEVTSEVTFFMINWNITVSGIASPILTFEDSAGGDFERTLWKGNDWTLYNNSVATIAVNNEVAVNTKYNWSITFDPVNDDFNATFDGSQVATYWEIDDNTKNFSQIYLFDTVGYISADEFYMWNGSSCPTEGVADTCTYGGSGNWDVDCADNCVITSPVNVNGDIILNGAGTFEILADIKANSIAIEQGCQLINAANDGNELAIAG